MLLNDILDIRARPALKRLHSHSPTSFVFDFHGNANKLLVAFSTQRGFINFNVPGKTVAGGANHRNPSLMKHEPRRLVTAHPQHPLQRLSTRSIFLARQPPDCLKPHAQRDTRILENRSGQG